MTTHVYFTVNSGLYFSYGDTGVFIDGIHGGAELGFSPVHPRTVQCCADRSDIFENLKALLFTHCHSDHFNADLVSSLAGKNDEGAQSSLAIFTPEDGKRTVPLSPIGPLKIFAVKTRHDGGKPLCFTPHVSFVINAPDATFLAAGDAVFTEHDAERIRPLCQRKVKAAFVNPYQILLPSNREFLAALGAECHVLVHLPLAKDDKYNARLLYDNAVKKYPAQMQKLLLPGFYSQVF